jgi:hypothetical protein
MRCALAILLLLHASAVAAPVADEQGIGAVALKSFPGSTIDKQAPAPDGGDTVRLSLTGDLAAVSGFFQKEAQNRHLHLLQPAEESHSDFRIYVYGTDEHPAANLLFVTLSARDSGGVTAIFYEKFARP